MKFRLLELTCDDIENKAQKELYFYFNVIKLRFIFKHP